MLSGIRRGVRDPGARGGSARLSGEEFGGDGAENRHRSRHGGRHVPEPPISKGRDCRVSGKKTARKIAAGLELLSERQREILKLMVAGKSTKEIAYFLHVSAKTVETHRARMMQASTSAMSPGWLSMRSGTASSTAMRRGHKE